MGKIFMTLEDKGEVAHFHIKIKDCPDGSPSKKILRTILGAVIEGIEVVESPPGGVKERAADGHD